MLYIGKVQLDNKEIVEIPPLKFKKHIWASKSNPFLGGFNIETYGME